ncbi:MAG: MotA/TolQ/ExbB proton channel family protein [Nevskiales bacterium]
MSESLWLQALLAPYGSISDFLDSGGWVLRWILAASILLLTLVVERGWFYMRVLPQQRAALRAGWLARKDRSSWGAHQIRRALMSQMSQQLNAGLPLIRVMVPLCPLLGLLGTVTGMLEVFDAMLAQGTADIKAMAYGVSHAMVSTMAGLAVSLLAMLFVNRYAARVRGEVEHLPDLLPVRHG